MTKSRGIIKSWTREEVALLKRYYLKIPLNELAIKLGRTETQIRCKRKNLNLPSYRDPSRRRYRVTRTGCWEWTGARVPGGYGKLTIKGKSVSAHRKFYEDAKGAIPEGYYLDHLCKNRPCVRPDHLEVVTPTENVRRSIGVKLNMKKAQEIRENLEKLKVKELAEKYCVSVETIIWIRRGKSWINEERI